MSPSLAQHTCGLAVDHIALSASLPPLLLRNGSSTGPQMREERRGKTMLCRTPPEASPGASRAIDPRRDIEHSLWQRYVRKASFGCSCLSFIGAGAGSLSVKRIVRSVAAGGVDGLLLGRRNTAHIRIPYHRPANFICRPRPCRSRGIRRGLSRRLSTPLLALPQIPRSDIPTLSWSWKDWAPSLPCDVNARDSVPGKENPSFPKGILRPCTTLGCQLIFTSIES